MYNHEKSSKYETCAIFHRFHILYISCEYNTANWNTHIISRSLSYKHVDSSFLKILVKCIIDNVKCIIEHVKCIKYHEFSI